MLFESLMEEFDLVGRYSILQNNLNYLVFPKGSSLQKANSRSA